MIPTNPLSDVAALLSAASSTPGVEARAIYVATARSKVDSLAEQVRELQWRVERAEHELVRLAGPTITAQRLEPT
jgi:hypothetical protein